MLDHNIKSGCWIRPTNARGRKNEKLHGLVGFVVDGAVVFNTLLFWEDGKMLRSEYINPKEMIVIEAPDWGKGFRALEIPSVDWMGGMYLNAVYDPKNKIIIHIEGGGDFRLKASTVLWRMQRSVSYLKKQLAA